MMLLQGFPQAELINPMLPLTARFNLTLESVEPSILRGTSSPPLYLKVSLIQPQVVKKATERTPGGE
jgi:hypothetical protein